MKYRHEYKFLLNYSEYLLLRQRLNSIMEHDKNINENGEITSDISDNYVDAFDLSLEDLGSQGHNKMQNDFYSVNMTGKNNH